MSFECLLIHTCTIEKNIGVADAYGQPADTWDDHLVDEPCRLVTGAGRELTVGAEVVVADYKLFLNDVDVTEQHRVVLDSVTYEILLVMRRANGFGNHHRECLMRTVR